MLAVQLRCIQDRLTEIFCLLTDLPQRLLRRAAWHPCPHCPKCPLLVSGMFATGRLHRQSEWEQGGTQIARTGTDMREVVSSIVILCCILDLSCMNMDT